MPGSLEHASGDVDEFEAGIVRGAEGLPAAGSELAEEELVAEPDLAEEELVAEPDLAEDGLAEAELDDDDLVEDDLEDRELAAAAAAAPVPAGARRPAREREGNRFINFLRASWAELQRVQWPDRRQVGQATAVVLGFVIVAGAYLGIADALAQRIVNFIL